MLYIYDNIQKCIELCANNSLQYDNSSLYDSFTTYDDKYNIKAVCPNYHWIINMVMTFNIMYARYKKEWEKAGKLRLLFGEEVNMIPLSYKVFHKYVDMRGSIIDSGIIKETQHGTPYCEDFYKYENNQYYIMFYVDPSHIEIIMDYKKQNIDKLAAKYSEV